MIIKVTEMCYADVIRLPKPKHVLPKRPSMAMRTLLKAVASSDLKATSFSCTQNGMERLGADEPALFLMNHSSFIDLKIAAHILYPRPFNIVCTSDGFVGKAWLMREMGCIPTKKFITDTLLVRDMIHAAKQLGDSILLYPEASYSFDGTATSPPDSIGKLIKLLDVPVVMIRTYGAFLRDPLYNSLQLRDTNVSAEMTYLLSREDLQKASIEELNALVRERFTFDHFAWQKEHNVIIDEPFRADGLDRVLYRCPVCQTEGDMSGQGTKLVCNHCHKSWTLTELGELKADDGNDIFPSVPAWYRWERDVIRASLADGSYTLDCDVDLYMMVDMKSLYHVGRGHLVHNADGFTLTGCGNQLHYHHAPLASYSLYSDFYWYELGDMICIGDTKALYYCFPTDKRDIVAKTRLAAEELYKMKKKK